MGSGPYRQCKQRRKAPQPPDASPSNARLSRQSGREVARDRRRWPGLAGVRVMALSGSARAEDRRPSPGAGIDVPLAKPADPDE